MPNIEVFGFDKPMSVCPELVRFIVSVWKILESEAFVDDVVVTPVYSNSYNRISGPLPYLRVWDTQEARGKKITNILRMNGFRVERPAVLEEYVEPSMWSEEEIASDLKWIFEADWLGSRIRGTLVSTAIEDLRNHEYEKVVAFYVHVVRELRATIGTKGNPSTGEIADWATSDGKKVCRDENDPVGRLIMLVQIIFSLMPGWHINRIFPAD